MKTTEEQAHEILDAAVTVAEPLSVVDSQIFWSVIEGRAMMERNKRMKEYCAAQTPTHKANREN